MLSTDVSSDARLHIIGGTVSGFTSASTGEAKMDDVRFDLGAVLLVASPAVS
jgi:hypothetical protein